MKREIRHIANAQLRAKKADKPGIEGYAAVFNQLSEDLGWFRETIIPGAFHDCLCADPPPDVRALFNHNPDAVLGRTTAKTLRLQEDSTGLHFDCDLPDTQAARDLLTSIERGDISQCSFGFSVRKQKWAEEQDGDDMALIRELHAVDVFDVSPVTFPAYPQTSVDKRALRALGRALAVFSGRSTRQEDDEDENENGCECDCQACTENDACDECTNVACDDQDCEDAGCPNQSGGDFSKNSLRGAVAFQKTPASDSDSWDGDAARGRIAKWASSDGSGDKDKIDWSKYARAFAWVDPENKDNFGGYKLPHHDVKDGKLVSVWGGVRAAMSALLGGRGGTNIPDGDRRAVYNHLKKEYGVHGKKGDDVPEFHSIRTYTPEIMRMMIRAASAAA
jgi:HK97 family phage prohead protease